MEISTLKSILSTYPAARSIIPQSTLYRIAEYIEREDVLETVESRDVSAMVEKINLWQNEMDNIHILDAKLDSCTLTSEQLIAAKATRFEAVKRSIAIFKSIPTEVRGYLGLYHSG